MAESPIPIRAEIGASVWKIVAGPGDAVGEEEPILILESMKMEIPVVAPHDGVVVEILVSEGQQVEEGQAVATFSR